MAHTEAPWTLDSSDGYSVRGKNNQLICEMRCHNDANPADAALVMAAPELLALCKSLLESFDLLTGPESPFAGNKIALGAIRGALIMYSPDNPKKIVFADDLARRVIKKAEGK